MKSQTKNTKKEGYEAPLITTFAMLAEVGFCNSPYTIEDVRIDGSWIWDDEPENE